MVRSPAVALAHAQRRARSVGAVTARDTRAASVAGSRARVRRRASAPTSAAPAAPSIEQNHLSRRAAPRAPPCDPRHARITTSAASHADFDRQHRRIPAARRRSRHREQLEVRLAESRQIISRMTSRTCVGRRRGLARAAAARCVTAGPVDAAERRVVERVVDGLPDVIEAGERAAAPDPAARGRGRDDETRVRPGAQSRARAHFDQRLDRRRQVERLGGHRVELVTARTSIIRLDAERALLHRRSAASRRRTSCSCEGSRSSARCPSASRACASKPICRPVVACRSTRTARCRSCSTTLTLKAGVRSNVFAADRHELLDVIGSVWSGPSNAGVVGHLRAAAGRQHRRPAKSDRSTSRPCRRSRSRSCRCSRMTSASCSAWTGAPSDSSGPAHPLRRHGERAGGAHRLDRFPGGLAADRVDVARDDRPCPSAAARPARARRSGRTRTPDSQRGEPHRAQRASGMRLNTFACSSRR